MEFRIPKVGNYGVKDKSGKLEFRVLGLKIGVLASISEVRKLHKSPFRPLPPQLWSFHDKTWKLWSRRFQILDPLPPYGVLLHNLNMDAFP